MAKPMRNGLKFLLGLLLTTSVVVGGELIWIEDDGSTVEPASLLKAAVSESHLGFPDDDKGPGTLLSWRYGEGNTGGPDLDAPLVTDRICHRRCCCARIHWCLLSFNQPTHASQQLNARGRH